MNNSFDRLKRVIATPSLTGIRSVWNDTVASGLTPHRLAAMLQSASQGDHNDYLTLAEEMEERDLHYACELGKRKLAVSKLPVTVESASDSAHDKNLANAAWKLTKRSGFRWLLKDLLDALGKGFAVAEIIWDRSASLWWPKAYEYRDPHWFCWDRASLRKIRLRDEKDVSNGIELAAYKFIVHTPRIKSGIPIRGGFARLSAWAYMCKGYTLKDWLAFAEVFGMPMRLGKYRPGSSKKDIEILKMAVENLGTDAAAVFPEGMEIELKEATKSRTGDFFERLAQYLDNQVTKGILGQTATTEGTPGKLGNEHAQNEVRQDIRDDDAGQLENTLQRDLVEPFINLNFGPQESYPVLRLRAPKAENIAALVGSLDKLVPLGLSVEASVIRDKLGLPDPKKGAEVLGAPGSRPVVTSPAQPAAINREDSLLINKGFDLVAEEYLAEDWQSAIEPILEPIREALEAANDATDFNRQLGQIFENQDITKLTRSLAKAMFIAYVQGLVDEN